MKYKKILRQSILVPYCLLASITLPLSAYAQQVIDNASGQEIGVIQANGQIDSPTGQALITLAGLSSKNE